MPCTTLTVVEPPRPDIRATNIRLAASSIYAGQSVGINVDLHNYGNAGGSCVISITANGTEIHRGSDYVNAGETVTYVFTWTPPSTGTYQICGEVVG